MTLVLVSTPGDASANAYCTVVEADAYFETIPKTTYKAAWTGASATEKTAALVMATRVLDAYYEWEGWPTAPNTQALLWPRSGLFHRNGEHQVDDTEIPQELKDATAELARQLLAADRTADNAVETQGLLALSAGPVSLQFKDNVRAKVIPDAVVALLPPDWGRVRGRGMCRPLERV